MWSVWVEVPAGEGSNPNLSLSLSAWLQFGVPLTPAPHLHVQKSPVLKCCSGVPLPLHHHHHHPPPPPSARVVNPSAICLSAYESSSSTVRPVCVVLTCNTCFSGLFPGDISAQGGVRTQVTVVCHGFCPQCLSFYFHTDGMELNLEAGGWF